MKGRGDGNGMQKPMLPFYGVKRREEGKNFEFWFLFEHHSNRKRLEERTLKVTRTERKMERRLRMEVSKQ